MLRWVLFLLTTTTLTFPGCTGFSDKEALRLTLGVTFLDWDTGRWRLLL